MKRVSLIVVFSVISLCCYSQYIVRLSSLKLTENFGKIYKSPLGAEIGFCKNDLDARWQLYNMVGYYRSRARLDEFPSYGIESGNSDPNFYPIKAIYKNFQIVPITFSGSYNLLDKPFTPFISLGVIAYFGSYHLETSGGLISQNGSIWFGGIGLKPDIGLMYTHPDDTFQIQLSTGKLLSIPYKSEKIQYWQTNISYLFYL